MVSVKEKLYKTIENLDDELVQKILDYTELIQNGDKTEETMKRLAKDPSFEVPSKWPPEFSKFDPIPCKGTPASQILIKDRR